MTDLVLVEIVGDDDYQRTLNAAVEPLRTAGHHVETVEVPAERLPDLDAEDAETWDAFKHTPTALLEAWRVARHIESLTEPGATVVMADRGGKGGVLALGESAKAIGDRRRLWTIAADSLYLEWLAVAGTTDGVPDEVASLIDWEIAQYRASERVLALSDFVLRHTAALGADVERLAIAAPDRAANSPTPAASMTVWLPEPVSRRAQTATILRALSGHDVDVVFDLRDEQDAVWSGTTWETLASLVATFEGRVTRARQPATTPTLVVLGDMTGIPDAGVARLVSDGVPVVVAAESTAAALWPDAATWADEDDLSAIVGGGPARTATVIEVSHRPKAEASDGRARRVSVGVPVFQDVSFLEESVESILNQTEPPFEVLLIDDGSGSAVVTETLDAWERRDQRIHTLSQPNRGVCVARNRMIEAMTGDSFLLVDADDVLEPEFIEHTAAALRNDDRLWAAATWTRFFGVYDAIEAKPPFDRSVGLRENPIVSTAALVDMAVRERGLRFAPDLAFIFCEDWHFWSQIVAAGGEIGMIPRPLIKHRTHHASGGYQRTALALDLGTARATAPLRAGPDRSNGE